MKKSRHYTPCSLGHFNVWEPLFEASAADPKEMKHFVSNRLKITKTEAHPHVAVHLLQLCRSHYLKRRSENLHICVVGTSYKACSTGEFKQPFQTHELAGGRKENAPTEKQAICGLWNYRQCQLSLIWGICTAALFLTWMREHRPPNQSVPIPSVPVSGFWNSLAEGSCTGLFITHTPVL